MLFTTVILESPYLFESLNLPNDFKCKALFYMHRLMRGLSICTTCFLSVLQAITISHSTSWDFFFVGLMLLSSAYMVVLLSRHRKQTQHLHCTSLTSRISAEKRATQTILVLVNLFVVMYDQTKG
ncbi:vomeronasal type-1 receptor 90-like [Thomomys bottae]